MAGNVFFIYIYTVHCSEFIPHSIFAIVLQDMPILRLSCQIAECKPIKVRIRSDTEWGQRDKQLQNNRLKSTKWDYAALRKTKLSGVGYGAGPSWAACSQNRDYDPRAEAIVKLCMCFQTYKRLEASYLTPSSNRIRGTLEQAANQAHENTDQALSADAIRLSLIKL